MDMSTMTSMDMSMTTTTAAMAMTATTSAMSMTTSSSSMEGMDMSSTMSSMASMSMSFFEAASTTLWSLAWTPNSEGQYAATCIFLVVLATLSRVLITVRGALAATAWAPRPSAGSEKLDDEVEAAGAPRRFRAAFIGRPFRIGNETARALFDMMIAGVGYLLMLAVMTMNLGYFLSVLGGVFLGSFLVGRFGPSGMH